MAKRKSIQWAGFKHENPIPNASMIGNILMSSIISGRDPETHTMPPDAEAQIANIFKHIKACVEAAGGTVDDILKVNFWVKDPAVGRKMLNGPWTAMFPDEKSRPARHTLSLPANAAKCNVANPCAQMKLEIQRACTAARKSDAGKAFADSARQVCDKYSGAPATAR